MVNRRIEALLAQLRQQGIHEENLLKAITEVPRERSIDKAFEHKAWDNVALPIGSGQTISQPYMVERMTTLLELKAESCVLRSAPDRAIRPRFWCVWWTTSILSSVSKACSGRRNAA